ncbi:hypothetical protein WMY93_029565 [Mugilogobius chulae]|uniref:L1 transposable element RRM domain-containing protein n=1 Tax=Mugilogobius chulae TaxID=88201 RepID=A0AAW0MRL2_9GOBI
MMKKYSVAGAALPYTREKKMTKLSQLAWKKTEARLEETEARIDEVETTLQATSALLKQLLQRQDSMEAKLTDQEARARRENLRIYGIPEEAEGNNIIAFLEKLLCETLDFTREACVKIERAHRALGPKPTGQQTQPRSIIVKFSSFRVKEEVIKRAWQKKQVMYNNTRFFVDHDYPPAIQKKRTEYNQAKRVLKERKSSFKPPILQKCESFMKRGRACTKTQRRQQPTCHHEGSRSPLLHLPLTHISERYSGSLRGRWLQERAAATASVSASTEVDPRQRMMEKLQEYRRHPPADK